MVEELGSEAHVFFRVDAAPITVDVRAGDDDASLLIDGRAILTARVDARSEARVGSRLALAVDSSRFHFFDAVTGESLIDHGEPWSSAPPSRSAGDVGEEVLTTCLRGL